MRSQEEKYKEKFESDKSHSLMLQAAFKQVSDIRKFEIELYWKRATYFWALIAVAYAGFFSIASSEEFFGKLFSLSIVSAAGFVFTFAWFTANKGSKYWQENWESHLDLLEDNVTGPLYKSYLDRSPSKGFSDKYVTGPQRYSVSKINQWVAVFTMITWVLLSFFPLASHFSANVLTCATFLKAILYLIAPGLSLVFCKIMLNGSETNEEPHTPNLHFRKVNIKEATK